MECTNPTGQSLETKQYLNNKYDLEVTSQDVQKNVQRLTNQLWKLIPMREHEEDWKKQLTTVTIEIAGLGSLFPDRAAILQLLSKLEGLNEIETTFGIYRKTVFECINLIQSFGKNL